MTLLPALKRLYRIKLLTIATLLVVLALLISAMHLAMLYLPKHKAAVEQWLSGANYAVSIEELKGEWHNIWPALDVSGMKLKDPHGNTRLELAHLQLELNLLQSLRQGTPVFRQVLLDRLELQLVADVDGGWRLQGLGQDTDVESVAGSGLELAAVLAELGRHGQVRLVNALLAVRLADGSSIPPQVINAVLQNGAEDMALQLRLERSRGEAVEFRALGQGHPGSDEFAARFYLKLPETGADTWKRFVSRQFPQLQQLTVAAEVWGHWQGLSLQQLHGQLQIPRLLWQQQSQAQDLVDFQARLLVSRGDDQVWQLQLDELSGQLGQGPLPVGTVQASWRQGGALQLALQRLELEAVTATLPAFEWLPAKVKEDLAQLRPRGTLKNLRVNLPSLDADGLAAFELRADLDRVAVSAWHGAPELAGVDGLLQLNKQGGRVDFDSGDFRLNFPKLYQQGWDFKRARGAVSWHLESDLVRVESERLQVWADGLSGNGRFSLEVPLEPGGESSFTLMVGMDDSNGALAPLFVPDQVVNPNLFDWLSSAIVAGRLNSGGFVYHGSLDAAAPAPSMQMFFDVSDGTIRYQPQWPAISSADAFTLVKGSEVLVAIDRGQIYQTRVNGGHVYLPARSARLQVQTELQGPAADVRKVLLESPIRAHLGDQFSDWQLTGQAATELDLVIDLQDTEDSQIRVASALSDGRYYSDPLQLAFEKIRGTIHYQDRKGLFSSDLRAQFFAQPISARINTRQQKDGSHTVIDVDGSVDIERLNRWLKQPMVELFSGRSRYRASLDLCASRPDCSSLTVSSDLRGVSSRLLPPPFDKSAQQARVLKVQSQLGGNSNWLEISYGGVFHSWMSLRNQQLTAAELVLGAGQPPPRPRNQGLWIRGELPAIEWLAWQRFIEQQFPDTVNDSKRPGIDPLLQGIDLRTDQLLLAGSTYHDVDVRLRPAADGWRVELLTPIAKGRIDLPGSSASPISAELDYLYLPAGADEPPAEGQPADPLQDVDPRNWPAIRLSVADLQLAGEPYGRWQLLLEPVANGVHIGEITGQVRKLDVEAELWWLQYGSEHKTRIDLTVTADELADVQEAWGNAKALESRDMKAVGQLRWNGSPLYFNPQSLNGELDLKSGRGRLLDLGTAGDALKLFGVLNVKALGRRLRLDFRDLYRGGLSFDTITGHYRIEQGVATSTSALKLNGPSADMELEGSFDLVNETLDQRLRMTLPLAENISLAAVFLGAPQVAGAVFLFDKLTGKSLSRIASNRYTLTGSWDDPVVEAVKSTARDLPPIMSEK